MERRKSICIQPQGSPTTEESLITRSTSFTLDATRKISGARDGVRILQGYPLPVDEPSPRRTTKFQFPGSRILKAGFGFRRSKKPAPLKSPCVWADDIPKQELSKAEDSARRAHLEKSFTDCGSTTETLDLFPEEGILSLPLADSLQPTVFTLSRLSETKCMEESTIGTPLTNTARTDTTRRTLRPARSSISSYIQSTPRTGRPSIGVDSISSWRENPTSERWNPSAVPFPAKEASVEDERDIKQRPAELDSDVMLGFPRRSFSTLDLRCSSRAPLTPSEDNSATPPVVRPRTRFDSRLNGTLGKKLAGLNLTSRTELSQETKTTDTQESAGHGVRSFRSEEVLVDSSTGYKRLEMETTRPLFASRSERNLCIGQRPKAISSSVILNKKNQNLRCMKPENLVEPVPMSSRMAESLSIHKSIEENLKNGLQKEEVAVEVEPEDGNPVEEDPSLSLTQDSLWDNNDCSSVLEDPKSLAMWFDWLEERSDLTRKEILYRIKCQKAFIQESNETLGETELLGEEFKSVVYPTMKDRLRALRRHYVKSSGYNNANKDDISELEIDDDEIVDIALDELEEENTEVKSRCSFQLNI